jgi:hypothetical protein
MRCRAGLGQGPRVLPASTSRFVPLAAVLPRSVRIAVRYQPFAAFPPILRQGRGSADEQPPAALTGQAVPGVTHKVPPLMLVSPCFLLHRLVSILIESKSLWPNGPGHRERPSRCLSDLPGPPPGRDAVERGVRRSVLSERSLPSVSLLALFRAHRPPLPTLSPEAWQVFWSRFVFLCFAPLHTCPILFSLRGAPNAQAHRERPERVLSDSAAPQRGRDAVARLVSRVLLMG